jgi:hypothetical protein
MAALRGLLADGYVPPPGSADENEITPTGGKKTQDFKLEVLSRSVDYIHQLLDKISGLESELENERRRTGDGVVPVADDRVVKKRKRTVSNELASTSSTPLLAPTASRLPSISSLLNPQLPSPPMSSPMYPTMHDVPPVLTLPAATSASGAHAPSQRSSSSPRSQSAWTPDEARAASVLLNISSKSDTSGSPSVSPVERRDSIRSMDSISLGPPASAFHPAMTPGGILGMYTSRS